MQMKADAQIQPLNAFGQTYEGIMVMDESCRSYHQYRLFSIAPGGAYKQMMLTPRILLETCNDAETPLETALSYGFKLKKCAVCGNIAPAIKLSQSPLGNICLYCLNHSNPPLPFKVIKGIERYVERDRVQA